MRRPPLFEVGYLKSSASMELNQTWWILKWNPSLLEVLINFQILATLRSSSSISMSIKYMNIRPNNFTNNLPKNIKIYSIYQIRTENIEQRTTNNTWVKPLKTFFESEINISISSNVQSFNFDYLANMHQTRFNL